MIHKSEPSQLFLDSIHAAFHLAQGQGEITPSAIWDHVVGICLRRTHTFAEMVEQAMLLISDLEIATRFGYSKFTPGTYSVADFIPAYHPAIVYLINAHKTSTWAWLCPLHHGAAR